MSEGSNIHKLIKFGRVLEQVLLCCFVGIVATTVWFMWSSHNLAHMGSFMWPFRLAAILRPGVNTWHPIIIRLELAVIANFVAISLFTYGLGFAISRYRLRGAAGSKADDGESESAVG